MASDGPLRIRLSEERKRELLGRLAELYGETFDEDLSDYRAERILQFFIEELAPPIYNQAITDAHAWMIEKLQDLQGDFYEPEADDRR